MHTEQITLELPGTEAHGQMTLVLNVSAVELAVARDLTTWGGMADELTERLIDFAGLTLAAQGMVIGAALASTAGATSLDDYLEGMHRNGTEARTPHRLAKFIAMDALGMAAAWGVEQ